MGLVRYELDIFVTIIVLLIYVIIGPPLGLLVLGTIYLSQLNVENISKLFFVIVVGSYAVGVVQAILVSLVSLVYRVRTGRVPVWVPLLAAAMLATMITGVRLLLAQHQRVPTIEWVAVVFAIHLVPAAVCWAITKPLMR